MNKFLTLACAGVMALTVWASPARAGDFDPEHKVVIQVSENDPQTWKIALNNAVNMQKDYGMDNVAVEVVAYGPGLGILTAKSPEAARVVSLSKQDIHFTACGNTMKKVERKTGKAPVLSEGVSVTPAGVVRIIELQEQGYAYIRP
ncbi:DsrE family protein [Magnetofaba australis]|nr:DsrE family protein [Magnetofaba australis]